MPKQFGSQVDLQKIPILNIVIHSSTSEPTTPVNGQFWFDTTAGVMKVREAGVWLLVANAAAGSNPTGPAGGDLTGSSYPNPVIAALAVTGAKMADGTITTGKIGDGQVTSLKIADATITDTDVAAANKDGADATVGMRTLGYSAGKAMPGVARLDQIAVPTAAVSLNNQRITSVGTPSAGTDATTKDYVDNLQAGLSWKQAVRVASIANVVSTGADLNAGDVIDGITLATGDRVLLKNQTNPAINGIWTAGPSPVRSTDADSAAELYGATVFVIAGTHADQAWTMTTNPTITVDTTPLTWVQFGAGTSYTAGTGMTLTGSVLDVIGTTNRITAAADSIDIAATYVGQASITTLGTVTTGVWNGTAIPIAYGGTGAGTAAAARTALGAIGKYGGWMPALTAGVESTITHNLGTTEVVCAFIDTGSSPANQSIELGWRFINANSIGVTADIAMGGSRYWATVVG